MVLADASNTARKRGGATVAGRPPNPPRRSWILCAPASTTNRFTQMPASSGPNRSLTSEEIASNGSTGSIPVRVARQYDAPVSHPGGVLATQEVERPGVRTLHLRLATHHGPFVQRQDGCPSRSGRRFESCTGHHRSELRTPARPAGNEPAVDNNKESRHARPPGA